jgi:Rps23 Pro-64 3,4-dihydroxylase Tpa1-like proline 4-hydroxylase
MVLFMVQAGRSYHSVQEVFAAERPRLSIRWD